MSGLHTTLLTATALASVYSVAQAEGLDKTVVEADPVAALSQLATVSGTTGTGAYSVTPEWSEELGFNRISS